MFVVLIFVSSLAWAEPATTQNCGQFDMGAEGKYCITVTEGSQNPDVLYFFHGRKKGEKAWMDAQWPQRVRQAWGLGAPTVVTVSFGGNWLLVDKNSRKRSGLYDVFANRVLPFMEEQIEVFSPGATGRRLLMGESMGGYNAAQMYLRMPKFFSRAVLVCPAIATVSPFAGVKASLSYIKRTGASLMKVFIGHMVSRLFMPDHEAWEKNDPLELVQNIDSSYPPLFVSAGSEDTYGFFEGAEKFAEIAKEKGVDSSFELVEGGHCSFNPNSVTKFLKHEVDLVHPVSRDFRAQASASN